VENVSQLVLRNAAQLGAEPLLLVNPPRDALAQELQRVGRSLHCFTQDFGDYRWLQALGANVEFGTTPCSAINDGCVLLFLPREKERLGMLLHALADRMGARSRLWVVGENRGGIKSAPRHVGSRFAEVSMRDSARHCRLFEASGPIREQPFVLEAYLDEWSMPFAGKDLAFSSLPGVFAHGRLDEGTALLLEVLATRHPQGRILDFACGCGVVGIALLAMAGHANLTFLDSSALAIESSRRSLERNGFQAEVVASDGLSELSGTFDWIVSNPPFHRGLANDLEVAAEFFHQSGTFLAENGKIVIVFNRHLPYSKWLHQSFGSVERLAENAEYVVICASRPIRGNWAEETEFP